MHLRHLWLKDFRSYETVNLELTSGICAVLGPNGVGKSNLLEAVSYLALLESFRGAPTEAMILNGAAQGVVRGQVIDDQREQLIEAELLRNGRNRVLVNKQRISRNSDLTTAFRVSVFSPDDLEMVKGGPAGRRNYLDQVLVTLDPKHHSIRAEFDKALRQRNALLKQCRGRLDDAAKFTLEVWDTKLIQSGEQLAEMREHLVDQLEPLVRQAYTDVASDRAATSLKYEAPWRKSGLEAALHAARDDEIRRGVTLVGPHRDDLYLELNAMAARTHASQGEQRSVALSLRLAAHRLVLLVSGSAPVLLLDDVFSELDPLRSAALLRSLPEGQTLLSTASGLPPGIVADQEIHIAAGTVNIFDVSTKI